MTMVKLAGGRFQQADYSIGRYAARPPVGTTLEDVMHPEYFQNEIDVLRPGMVINVLSDDFALDCDLRVLTVSKTTANMRIIRHHSNDGPKVAMKAVSEVEVNHGGPHHNWRFLHNGQVIEKGFATKDEAETAAQKYVDNING